jgi:hypothetical protein
MNYSTLSKLDKTVIYLQFGAIAGVLLGGLIDISVWFWGAFVTIFLLPLPIYLFARCVHFWRIKHIEPPYFVKPHKLLFKTMIISVTWYLICFVFVPLLMLGFRNANGFFVY